MRLSKQDREAINDLKAGKKRQKLAQMLIWLGAEVGISHAIHSALRELLSPDGMATVAAVFHYYTENRFPEDA